MSDKVMGRIWVYRSAVFLGGFLLFQVELMLAKALLPMFGGSYLVWAASVVFFQAVLLVGYLYSHWIQRKLGVVRYSRWHCLVLFVPFAVFPFRFDQLSSFVLQMPLALSVFYCLLLYVGLPFLVLSTANILLQSWLYASSVPERENPYALYSSSNFGSMVGLLTYPVLFEPFFTLTQQGYLWWAGYVLFVGLHMLCIPRGVAEGFREMDPISFDARNTPRLVSWFMLGLAGSFVLLAFTNVITFDIVSISFLWAIPLSVYLLTFILVFKQRPWFPVWIEMLFGWAIPVGIVMYLASLLRIGFLVWVLLSIQLAILFVVCMICNGWLARARPEGKGLTVYYLVVVAGGFAGSVLVGMIIPCINTFFVEYPGSFLVAVCVIAFARKGGSVICFLKDGNATIWATAVVIISLTVFPWAANHVFGLSERVIFVSIAFVIFVVFRVVSGRFLPVACVLLAVICFSPAAESFSFGAEKVKRFRNYYGVYLVYELNGQRYLKHGTTLHGREYLSGPKVAMPLSYYHSSTPVGELLSVNPFNFRKIGMIGLGAGSIAAYMNSSQEFTVYELDPDSLMIARKYFGYLRAAQKKDARFACVFGDGRISLRSVPDASLDLLIIDAFNNDSIPIHLMTVEAIGEYFRALQQDGMLLMHISNRIFDFSPVLFSAAQNSGVYACMKSNDESVAEDADFTIWMAFTRDKRIHDRLVGSYYWNAAPFSKRKRPRPWTDQYSNLFNALR